MQKKNIKNQEINNCFYRKFVFLFLIIFLDTKTQKKINTKINNNNFNPKISIFLPIYNKVNFLKRSIRSLQIQTLTDIEIILLMIALKIIV